MATNGMEIKVGADVAGALTGLQALAQKVELTDNAFEKAFKNISDSVDKNVASAVADTQKLAKGITTLEQKFQALGGLKKFVPPEIPENFRRFSASVDNAGASVSKLTPKVGGANTTLINFGRVVQDAPFGIIGIANNIDPLINSFQQLKLSTGSSSAAFKALGASLMGPAGIAVAISAVTSLLVVFAQRKQGAKKATEELEKVENVYANTLAKERVQLDNLFAIATNANVPLLARKDALKEIRDNYGAYLKNFSDEEILAGKAAAAYNLLSAALINVARARAAEAQQTEITKKILENEGKIAKIREDAQNSALNAKDRREASGLPGGAFRNISKQSQIDQIFLNARNQAEALRKENEVYTKDLNRLAGVIINNQVKPFKEVKTGAAEAHKEVKKSNDDLLLGYVEINGALVKNIELIIKQKEEQAKFNAEVLKQAPSRKPGSQLAERLSGNADGSGNAALAGLEGLDKLNEKLLNTKDLINNGLNSGIDQFFNAIANNQDPFKALAQSAARLVTELAAAVVKALLLKAISTAISGGTGGDKLFTDGLGKLTGSSGVIRGQDLTLLIGRGI